MYKKWRSSGGLRSEPFVLPPLEEGTTSSGSDADNVESDVGSDEAHAGGNGDALTHVLRNVRNGRERSSSEAPIPLPELYTKATADCVNKILPLRVWMGPQLLWPSRMITPL